MNINKLIRLACVVACTALSVPASAQDDYDPSNPPEPNQMYSVTLQDEPVGSGNQEGAKFYKPGETVKVSTSANNTANTKYRFLGWTLNGDTVSKSSSYSFTMPDRFITLVAHYEDIYQTEDPWEGYDPTNPGEPQFTAPKYRLTLTTNIEGSCSFNIASGDRYPAEQYVSLYPNYNPSGFKFLGWYQGGVLVSNVSKFSYLMPDGDVTLEAKFEEIPFDPESPGEPSSSQDDVMTETLQMGDVNGDRVVNTTDAVAVINRYLNKEVLNFHEKQADMNRDGIINTTDAVAIINKYLNKY